MTDSAAILPKLSNDGSPVRFSKTATATRFGFSVGAGFEASRRSRTPPAFSARSTTASSTRTPLSPSSAQVDGRGRLFGRTETGVPLSESSFSCSSATRTSSMCWKRRSGSLRRHCVMIRSSSCGISLRSELAGSGSSFRIAERIESLVSPRKARRPVSIS